MDQDIERRIRERAYEIWEEEGRPDGREAQHWQQACAEFADAQRESRASAPGAPKRKATRKKSASASGGKTPAAPVPASAPASTPGKPRSTRRKPSSRKAAPD